MSASIPIPFALDVTLWWIGRASHEVAETCPDCAGTRRVTVTFGTGESVCVGCDRCKHCHEFGEEYSTGVIRRTVRDHAPEEFIARRVSLDYGDIQYAREEPSESCWHPVKAAELFETREECEAECVRLNADAAKVEAKRAAHWREREGKSAAWHARYYRDQIKRAERDIEYANRKLLLIPPRSKARGSHADQ